MTVCRLDQTWEMRSALTSSVPRRSMASRVLTRDVSFWLLVAFLIATALLGRLAYLTKPFDHDARIFIYLGKLVCDGGRYYHDILDNKFPSVGLMTSICWRWIGDWWAGYVLLQTALSLAGALLLGRMAARYFGQWARLPAVLFALVYLNFNVAVFGGFQLETIQIFFEILAAGAALEVLKHDTAADAFVVGLAAGCAAMLKPTGLSVLGASVIATIFLHRRDLKRTAVHGLAAVLGLAIPATVVLIYLIGTNTLRDMPALYHQISRYAAATPLETSDYFKPFVVLTIALFPVIVRAWVFRRDLIPGRGGSETRPTTSRAGLRPVPTKAGVLFAIAWLALELIGAIMQKRMYAYHFLPMAAPAALLYAMWPRRDRAASLAAALIPLAFISIIASVEIISFYWGQPMRSPISEYLISRTSPGDSVWADSVPRILLETGLKPGARIPLTFLFLNTDPAPLKFSKIMLHDFDVRKPRYIVLPIDLKDKLREQTTRAPELLHRPIRRANYITAWRRITAYVHAHYTLEKVLDDQMIYRRLSDSLIATRNHKAMQPIADLKSAKQH